MDKIKITGKSLQRRRALRKLRHPDLSNGETDETKALD